MSPAEKVVAGIDLGGTAINYTFLDERGEFLIDGLCEHPARSVEGPDVCLGQIADGLEMACRRADLDRARIVESSLSRIARVLGGTFQHAVDIDREAQLFVTVAAFSAARFKIGRARV